MANKITTTNTSTIINPTGWSVTGASDATATSFAAGITDGTTTRPVSDANKIVIATRLAVTKIMPIGTDAANETFDIKIVAYSSIKIGGVVEWIPNALAHLSCILGTGVGATGGVIGATYFLADTITSTYATSGINIISPADNVPGVIEVVPGGAELLAVYFDMTGAAGGNFLYMNT